MIKKKTIVKFIGYIFQHDFQLTESFDDSNSVRGLSEEFDLYVIGRRPHQLSVYEIENYKVIFLPSEWNWQEVIEYILALSPDVIHFHGNHGWKEYPIQASYLSEKFPHIRLIFSPAGSSCGTESFLWHFNKVIVNHCLQIKRMRCEPEKVIVRTRSADPSVFYPVEKKKEFDFVYVAGFVPQKRIDLMIEFVEQTPYTMVILGDFTRTSAHYNYIKLLIKNRKLENQIFLHDFIPQTEMADFLGKCKAWVWPNIKPENPETTTNRSVIEALACGMPLFVGERAFKYSRFIVPTYNGNTFSSLEDFRCYAKVILRSYEEYGKNSKSMNDISNSFKENFIDFYNKLYGGI